MPQSAMRGITKADTADTNNGLVSAGVAVNIATLLAGYKNLLKHHQDLYWLHHAAPKTQKE